MDSQLDEIEKAIASLPLDKDKDIIVLYQGKKKTNILMIVDKSYFEGNLIKFSSLAKSQKGYVSGQNRLMLTAIHKDVVDQDFVSRGDSRTDNGSLKIDHTNTCKVDNRLRNLNLVTHGHNMRNRTGRVGIFEQANVV